jgi:hypothetical protein
MNALWEGTENKLYERNEHQVLSENPGNICTVVPLILTDKREKKLHNNKRMYCMFVRKFKKNNVEKGEMGKKNFLGGPT